VLPTNWVKFAADFTPDTSGVGRLVFGGVADGQFLLVGS
jgi:hypothetical protein